MPNQAVINVLPGLKLPLKSGGGDMSKIHVAPDTLLNPMPVVVVSCQAPKGKPNLITLAWVGIASSKPPSISIAVRPSRYSFDILYEAKEFVVNVPSANQVEAVDICGVVSGRDGDKFAAAGLTPAPCDIVKTPMIAEFPINLECKVTNILDLGAHHLFIGEVVAAHIDEKVQSDGKKVDTDLSSPIVYCYGSHEYRTLGKVVGSYGYSKK